MIKIHSQYTDYFCFNNLSNYSEIKHFVSSRNKKIGDKTFNNFNISLESNIPAEEVIKNRNLLSDSVKIPLNNFVMQNQVHGDNILVITEKYRGKGTLNHSDAIQNSDGMITNKKNICLFLFAADCMPILFYDYKKNVIGAAHSGWKGTVLKIAQKTVLKMESEFNSDLKDIIVGIGPSISVRNYEIGENVVKEVEKAFGTKKRYLKFNKNTQKYHFDLWFAAKDQLLEVGIPKNNIEISGYCTFNNNDLFFSARKNNTGRFGAGIMLI